VSGKFEYQLNVSWHGLDELHFEVSFYQQIDYQKQVQ